MAKLKELRGPGCVLCKTHVSDIAQDLRGSGEMKSIDDLESLCEKVTQTRFFFSNSGIKIKTFLERGIRITASVSHCY